MKGLILISTFPPQEDNEWIKKTQNKYKKENNKDKKSSSKKKSNREDQ